MSENKEGCTFCGGKWTPKSRWVCAKCEQGIRDCKIGEALHEAAPDLLAACKAVVDTSRHCDYRPMPRDMDALRAAIANAEKV